MTTTSSVGKLDTFFTSLITDLMNIERQPLTRLNTQKDTYTQQRAAYVDMDSKLTGLQASLRNLLTGGTPLSYGTDRSFTIMPNTVNTTVLTANVGANAPVGDYTISVTQLAVAQQRLSTAQTSIDSPLNKTGTLWLGGNGTASASVTPDATVSAIGTGTVASGLTELGTGTSGTSTGYVVEVADFNGTLKFRLKDADGEVKAIAVQGASDDSVTTDWQDVTAGTYDTKRGLTITFGAAPVVGTTTIDYTAAGTAVSVETSDTLVDIADKINAASQAEGREITASILGTQLALTAANSGTKHTMIYSDGVGLGFGGDTRTARDAMFTVNSQAFTRSSNTNLTDIIYGVTLNLADDAAGRTAKLTISENSSIDTAKSTIQTFLDKFNEVTTYLQAKTSVEKVGDTYTRGVLSTDSGLNDLRSTLFTLFGAKSSGAGEYQYLFDIGISIDDNLQVTISDSAKLEEALTSNMADVQSLMDSVIGGMDTIVSSYTGSSGTIQGTIRAYDSQLSDIADDIKDMNENLTAKEALLTSQYADMQAYLLGLNYEQQQWSTIFSTYNNYT